MRQVITALGILLGLSSLTVQAQSSSIPVQAKERSASVKSTAWLGFGTAIGTATVKHPNALGAFESHDKESGLLTAYTVNLTAVGALAFKLRYTSANIFEAASGDDDPAEFGAMIGLPFTDNPRRGPVLYAGFGRVFHADDSLQQPINGLAAEFSFFRWGGESLGGEMGIQGFYADKGDEEVEYIAFNVGLRFGGL